MFDSKKEEKFLKRLTKMSDFHFFFFCVLYFSNGSFTLFKEFLRILNCDLVAHKNNILNFFFLFVPGFYKFISNKIVI